MNDLPEMAIALIQPWAHLLVTGLKDIENRDWFTRYRGPVAIHASKAMPNDQWDAAMDMYDDIHPVKEGRLVRRREVRDGLQFGGIVGVVDIVDCVDQSDSEWFVGRYGFVIANARPVPFIPVKGKQGFFRWRPRVIVGLGERVE